MKIPIENLADGIARLFKEILFREKFSNGRHTPEEHHKKPKKSVWRKNIMNSLTPHQRKILEMVIAGNHSKDITDNMGMQVKDVHAHCLKIINKLEERLLAKTHKGS